MHAGHTVQTTRQNTEARALVQHVFKLALITGRWGLGKYRHGAVGSTRVGRTAARASAGAGTTMLEATR